MVKEYIAQRRTLIQIDILNFCISWIDIKAIVYIMLAIGGKISIHVCVNINPEALAKTKN